MEFAMSNGLRARAGEGVAPYYCPVCEEEVVAKRGKVIVWHFAHKEREECDPWWEPETRWHRDWKRIAEDLNAGACTEVRIGNHRADIVVNECVVELQHSPISPEEILERERFYRRAKSKMIWVLDGTQLGDRFDIRDAETHQTFRWKQPRKSFGLARQPIFIDLGDELIFEIKRLHMGHYVPVRVEHGVDIGGYSKPTGGWGYLWHSNKFIREYLQGCAS